MATVQDAATAYAEAEKHLRLAQKELSKVNDTYKTVHEDGTIGGLELLVRSATIKSLVGQIADAELAVVLNHTDDTERAKELGIDVPGFSGAPDVSARDGGGR